MVDALTLLGAALFVFFAFLSLGRFLKRRRGVPLGYLYQLLCLALALYLPLLATGLDYSYRGLELRRELLALVVVLGAVFIMALTDRFVWTVLMRRRRQAGGIPKFIRDLVAIGIMVVALGGVLGFIYGKTVPGLLAGSGIAAIILGFALQDLLGNVFSGMALEIGRPFRPGDWLHVDGRFARVVDVNWRSVRLITNDDITLDIPNNQIARNTIVNLTFPTSRHAMRLTVRVDYGAPPNRVKEVILRSCRNVPGVMAEPAPRVYLQDFADSFVSYELKFYMTDHSVFPMTADAIRTNIWYGFKRAGIRIPFPIRTLQIERPTKADDANARAFGLLRRFPLMVDLRDEQLRHLVESGRQAHYGQREAIIEQGDAGNSMFLMLSGRAEVLVRGENARSTTVATLREGDCFGEMSLLTGEPRAASVVAVTDCEVLEIAKPAMGRILHDNPQLAQQLGELLAERQLDTEAKVTNNPFPEMSLGPKATYTDTFLRRLNAYFGL